jgi:hypothetical protein
MNETLEDIIREHINIKNPTAAGWQKVFCEVCGDGSRTKGPRGGWLLNNDSASYHCFNCGIKGRLEPPYAMSKDVKTILEAFGIPLNKILYLRLLLSDKISNKPKEKPKFSYIDIPDYFVELKNAKSHPFYNIAINFLKQEKCIDHEKYSFYLSTGKSSVSPDENAKALYLKNRLIIPAFKESKMIYYQSRALIESQRKYVSVDKPKLGAMYFIDRLFDNTTNRLFITEGFFDAFHINGVAVMENYLTSEQEHLLVRCKKQKIIVPDRKGSSDKLLEFAIKHNWSISIPKFDDDVKDITECVKKNGRPYTIKLITDSIYSGSNVEFQIKIRK